MSWPARFVWAGFEKEVHPFFVSNNSILRPVVLTCFLQLRVAGELYAGSAFDQGLADILAQSLRSVVHVSALICRGDQWAEQVGPEIYRMGLSSAHVESDDNQASQSKGRLN